MIVFVERKGSPRQAGGLEVPQLVIGRSLTLKTVPVCLLTKAII